MYLNIKLLRVATVSLNIYPIFIDHGVFALKMSILIQTVEMVLGVSFYTPLQNSRISQWIYGQLFYRVLKLFSNLVTTLKLY